MQQHLYRLRHRSRHDPSGPLSISFPSSPPFARQRCTPRVQASRADATAPTRLPSIVSFPSPSSWCHACPLFLTSRRLSRMNTHTHTHTRSSTHIHVQVHARDARRARAKESAPRRPELSRSHGSSSGSGGDIPTYLPTYRAGCVGACVSQAPLHILLPSFSFCGLPSSLSPPTRPSSFTSTPATPRSNLAKGNRRRAHDSCGWDAPARMVIKREASVRGYDEVRAIGRCVISSSSLQFAGNITFYLL